MLKFIKNLLYPQIYELKTRLSCIVIQNAVHTIKYITLLFQPIYHLYYEIKLKKQSHLS